MISLLLTLVVYALIFYVLFWALGAIGLSDPFNKIIKVILVVAVVIVLLEILTGNIGTFPIVSRLGLN